jgi:hypothetical protein
MARFTIGIPTYNRADFLDRSLQLACNQTWNDVEVLVSDNASTDNTPEVVRSYGERVRYQRNSENIGMWANLIRVAEMATGEYFSWLQDDDLIHCDFARRAINAFRGDNTINMYSAFVIYTSSISTLVDAKLYGPPIALDWMHSTSRLIDGFLVIPISFFTSFSVPPATAYRTAAIHRAIRDLDSANMLYNERIVQAKAVADGKAAVDPWAAAIFYKHEFQGHLLGGFLDVRERSRQWVRMANELGRMLEERAAQDWRPLIVAWLDSVSPHDCAYLVHNILPPRQYWSQAHPLASEICTQIMDRVPESARRPLLGELANGSDRKNSIKSLARQLTPPFLWDALRKLKTPYIQ